MAAVALRPAMSLMRFQAEKRYPTLPGHSGSPRNGLLMLWILTAVAAGLFSGCSGRAAGDAPASPRIGVYSTAYLTQENTIAFASHTSTSLIKPARSEDWTWNGDGVLGTPSITIDLGRQTAHFFKGGEEVGRSPVSTGREGFSTPAGTFRIIQKNKTHASNLYGDFVDSDGNVVQANVSALRHKRPPGTTFRGAAMPFFMRVHGAVGIHAGHLPGYAASHGCIRLPRGAAQRFFENAPVGTEVRIIQ